MTLRDVLRQAVVKANLSEQINIEDEMIGGEEYKRLHIAANNVIRELASSYLPLLEHERVTIENNRLDLRVLRRKPIRILSLKDGGMSVRFTMYPTYMYAPNGIYDLVYSYLPDNASIDDELEVDPRVNEDMLSSGIASEYYLMTGNIEMGDLYDKKYRENLKNISITKREIKVKGRLFV